MNTYIELDVQNLKRPLVTIQAMQLCGVRIAVRRVPEDTADLRITIYKPDGTHFIAIPLAQNTNGDWDGFILGACFPTAGEAQYQIHYRDAEDHVCAGGKGKVLIGAFDPMEGGEVTPEGDIILTALQDDKGLSHKIVAVNRGTDAEPDWSWEIRD